MRNIFIALAAVVLVACTPATSQTPSDTITWTNPSQRTDGTALPLSEIKETVIAWGPRGGPYTQGSVTVPAPATTVAIPRPQTPGTRCYVAMVTDTGNRSSVFSNEACKTLFANPNPPTNLQAN